MSTPTQQLSDAGVSIWLDDLSRSLISSGDLAALIADRNVVGVTTNPSIFQASIGNPDDDSYTSAMRELSAAKLGVDDAIFAVTTSDVRNACDVFLPVFEASNGVDGRVSIEVSPELAYDTDATVAAAEALWAEVDRSNALIKIPATAEGLPAITRAIAQGISVNVTLIFSISRYDEVIDAYLTGLEQAQDNDIDLSGIQSVSSFFVSRVDSEVDDRLDAIGGDEAVGLKGKAGVANARLAYELFEQRFTEDRAQSLLAAGANVQRPLWASTSVKNPELPDTLYVTELVAAGCVNTMPGKTLEATFDHGEITGDTITDNYDDARNVMEGLRSVGVDFDDVTAVLEKQGVDKFIASWKDLKETVSSALDNPRD